MTHTPQQRALLRQIEAAKAEAKRLRKQLGRDLCRVAVLRWPCLKDK